MDMTLGIVLECSPDGCQVQLVDSGETIETRYSAAAKDRVRIRRQQLVAVNRAVEPPELVWRLFAGRVQSVGADGRIVVTRGADQPAESGDLSGVPIDQVAPVPGLEARVQTGDLVYYTYGTDTEPGRLYDVAVDGRPAHPELVARVLYPEIEAVYARIAAGRAV